MSNPIYNICRNIRKITDEDFGELEELGKRQTEFVHPLKGATQAKYNRLGKNNLAIIEHLKQIREIIKNNKP